jgi:hypothetical protein
MSNRWRGHLHEPPGPGGACRFDEHARSGDIDARELRVIPCYRNLGSEVDDRINAADCLVHYLPVSDVTANLAARQPRGAALKHRDVVSRIEQSSSDRSAEEAACTRDEHAHRWSAPRPGEDAFGPGCEKRSVDLGVVTDIDRHVASHEDCGEINTGGLP